MEDPADPLRRPSAVQNLPSNWTYRSVLIVTDRSLSSSDQNGLMMPCLEMATQAVHLTECNGFTVFTIEVMHSPMGSELADPSVDH